MKKTSSRQISGGNISDRVREITIFKFVKREDNDSRPYDINYTFSYLLKGMRWGSWTTLEVKHGVSYKDLKGELKRVICLYGNGYRPNISNAGCIFSESEKEGIEGVFEEFNSGQQSTN